MDATTFVPLLWAQAATTSIAPASGTTPGSTMMLALRRWSSSLTLSPPDPIVGPAWDGLWAWLIPLGVVLLVAVVAQGPARAIGQFFDLPGHARLLGAALARFRRSSRMLAMAIGLSVLAWTANQTFSYRTDTGRDDLLLLTKGKRLIDVALGQGVMAALTPTRDVVGLGLNIPLLLVAAVVLFQFSTDRWRSGIRPSASIRRQTSRWSTIGWACAALYALYRFVGLVTGSDLPQGGCVFVEPLVVPALMAMADGVLVAWVLVELRDAGRGDTEESDPLDVRGIALVIPASVFACLLTFPARYLSASVLLAYNELPVSWAAEPGVVAAVRWILGWGLVDLQAAGLAFVGLMGVIPWSLGTPAAAIQGYFRLLRAEGGHLAATLAWAGLAAGAASAAAYLLVLSLPASTWVLNAADSYAHYATLPVGLVLLGALIEMGERSLPPATLASPEVTSPAAGVE